MLCKIISIDLSVNQGPLASCCSSSRKAQGTLPLRQRPPRSLVLEYLRYQHAHPLSTRPNQVMPSPYRVCSSPEAVARHNPIHGSNELPYPGGWTASGIYISSSFIKMTITKYCLQCAEVLPAGTPNDKPYCSTTCLQQIYPVLPEAATETVSQTVTETVSESSIDINPFLAFGLFIGFAALFAPATKSQPDVVPKGLGALKNYRPKNTR